VLIDGLQCGSFDREIFEDLRRGGFICVTPTLGFWEGTLESLDAIGRWRDLARECSDVMLLADSVADILTARDSNRVAVLPGFQNTNCLEGRIRYVELFADLGVRVMQLTYNNQNELGASCYEESDSGLARFGKEVIREMNRAGVLVDLSHVGEKTTLDAIKWSEKPVAVTHANAASIFPHKRNKGDDVLRALRDSGGIIGCATYRNITPAAACDSVEAWCEMVARTVDIAGIDHVGIGTDTTHHSTQPISTGCAWGAGRAPSTMARGRPRIQDPRRSRNGSRVRQICRRFTAASSASASTPRSPPRSRPAVG
jgi:membrane dipeptidase